MKKTVIETNNRFMEEFIDPDDVYTKLHKDIIFNKLLMDEDGGLTANIIDEEGDPLECTFNHDNCVQIDTEKLGYIVLHNTTLEILSNLISDAEDIYDEFFDMEDKNPELSEKELVKKFKKEYAKGIIN